jgi:hypothetical protein
MIRAQNPNLQILEFAVERLGELTNEIVFLGGCATGLLMTDAAAPPIRATQDVDVITEVATLAEYHRMIFWRLFRGTCRVVPQALTELQCYWQLWRK